MSIKVWLDSKGIEQSMLNGAGLELVEHDLANQVISEIKGQFIIDFGFEGDFIYERHTTAPSGKYGTSRTAFRIVPGNKQTAAILSRHPGWLAKFAK